MSSLGDAVLAPDISLAALATHTAALVASDIVDLVARATYASTERVIIARYILSLHLPHYV